MITTASTSTPRVLADTCGNCSLSSYCQRADTASSGIDTPPPTLRGRKLAAGDHLYWHHDPMQAFYAIRSGSVKSYVIDADGTERVRGFLHRGDLIGLDALNSSWTQSSVQALVETEVCVVSREALMGASSGHGVLQKTLIASLSQALDQAYTLAGDYTADQRIARFLLEISSKSQDPNHLVLYMGRRDIANYLRLVTETVSRTLTRFQNQGWIKVNRRQVKLLDRRALLLTAGIEEDVPQQRPNTAAKSTVTPVAVAA